MRRVRLLSVLLILMLVLHGAAGVAAAKSKASSDDPGVMTYIGAGAANILYIPAKVVFALLGGFASGAAYVFTAGNSEVSSSVWNSSVNGSYVVTPAMIQGREPVRFVGP